MLPMEIRERIEDTTVLLNSLDDESFKLGIKELEELRPILEEFVKSHPNDPEGYLELSRTFQGPVFITMRMDNKSADKAKMLRLLMNYADKMKDYSKKAKYHLEMFCNLSPNNGRIKSVKKLIQMLENLEGKL